MTIYQGKDYKEICQKAEEIIASEIRMNPRAVLGLSTGSTPIGVYDRLVEWHQKGQLDFSGLTTINLDEYKGLGAEEDSDKACREYEEIIAEKGRIDLQLLGLGANGHIGFNEPGDAFISDTHCVKLRRESRHQSLNFILILPYLRMRRLSL